MPPLYTQNLGIEKPANGEEDGSWGTIVNENMDIIDRATNGVLSLALSGTASTLTTTGGTLNNGQYKLLVLGGTPSGTHTITLSPNTAQKIYFVRNTTAQSVVFTQGSGGNVTIATGDSGIIYTNGAGATAAVVNLTNDFAMSSANITGGTVSGTTITGGTVSGTAITTSTLNSTVIGGTTAAAITGTAITGTTITATGDVTISDKIVHAGDTNTSIRFPADDTVTVETAGVERLRITSTGDVQMPGATTETRTLEIGAGRTGNGGAVLDLIGDATYTDFAARLVRGNAGPNATTNLIHRGTGNLAITTQDAGPITFFATNLERVRITPAGDVGIGTITPSTKLDVVGTVNATGLSLSGTAVTSTAAELNLLDGASTTLAAPFLANPQNYIDPDNRVINGDFGFWQRTTSITGDGFAADRWYNYSVGGTVTQARASITPGGMIGANNPQFALNQTVASQTLSNHFAQTTHRIENASSYAGETITVLGWAVRVSGTGNMAVTFRQISDTGATLSNPVTTVTLSGSYQRFAVVMNIPSATGLTINGNDYLELDFWTSAGADFVPSGVTIGLQTIGVRLWGVHIKRGTHTTSAVDMYRPRLVPDEQKLCQRFYEKGDVGSDGGVASKYGLAGAAGFNGVHSYKVDKRASPTVAFGGTTTYENCSNLVSVVVGSAQRGFASRATITATGAYRAYNSTWSADAEFVV